MIHWRENSDTVSRGKPLAVRQERNMSIVTDKTTLTEEDFDAILRFLPVFEREGFEFAEYNKGGEGQFPYYSFSPEAHEFIQTLYDHNWIINFDWSAWVEEMGVERLQAPEFIGAADLEVLRKLLTTHVRHDRFCEGHLPVTFKNGDITAILKRVNEIRGSAQ